MASRPEWDELSEPERIFFTRWKELIGRFGTQKQAAKRLHFSGSAVSRDCTGETFPTDERRQALYRELALSSEAVSETEALLARAVKARASRTSAAAASGRDEEAGAEGSEERLRPVPAPSAKGPVGRDLRGGTAQGGGIARLIAGRSRRLVLSVAVSCVAILALISAALYGSLRGAAAPASCMASPGATLAQKASASARAAHASATGGLRVKSVRIPVTSLSPALAVEGGWSQAPACTAIFGFVFTNSAADLCLGANDTGPMAGLRGDAVRLAPCDVAKSQIWIPVQWDSSGSSSTWLANDEYQTQCLNADQTGGLRDGHRTELWDCYHSGNESWDFGDWYNHVTSGSRPYPLYLGSHVFCLDADKAALGAGDEVLIWNEYGAANQLWS